MLPGVMDTLLNLGDRSKGVSRQSFHAFPMVEGVNAVERHRWSLA